MLDENLKDCGNSNIDIDETMQDSKRLALAIVDIFTYLHNSKVQDDKPTIELLEAIYNALEHVKGKK